MKSNVGNPVEGQDFFDREKEQQRAWRKLESSHLLMLAPRRIGKTSLILRLCATAHAHGSHAVQCSFARCGDEQECVSLLFRTLAEQPACWERLVEPLKTVLGKLKGHRQARGLASSLLPASDVQPVARRLGGQPGQAG
jgi:uncharacterized protein